MNDTLDDVRRFWDTLPLGVDYVAHEPGTIEWFREFDRQKANYALVGVLPSFAPPALRGQRVLDVGCGPGFWARYLAARGVDYTGIDLSPRSAAMAARSLELLGLRGQVQVGNAEALPFADAIFDAVISEGVIHHTPDTQACIDGIHRVLRPGGRAAVSVYYRTAMLRSPRLFAIAGRVMRGLRVGLAGRGREGLGHARTPEEFVRMYDGASNPIGKAYTGPELRRAFGRFATVSTRRYFMPPIPPLVALPAPARSALARTVGLMVLVIARK